MKSRLEVAGEKPADWLSPLAAGGVVFVFQLLLVAAAGTDIPFYDQWGIEGSWLYPSWREGSLHMVDLLRPFNEHRMVWTHLLNLGLFLANGQWDPLVQLAAIAGLRAICAGGLVGLAGTGLTRRSQLFMAAAVSLAFLPQLAWHNVLWGIESHSYFVIGFSLLSLWLLGVPDRLHGRVAAGLGAGVAALLAMGPGALVPVSLLGLVGLRVGETRAFDRTAWNLAWPAAVLLVVAWGLHVSVPEHAGLGAATWREFFSAAVQVLAWPHVGQPFAALVLNLPLLIAVGGRLLRRRHPVKGENFILLVAGWSFSVALATAWVRGGGDELATGVPSRYVDFLVLLPLSNLWCVVALAHGEKKREWQTRARLMAVAWGLFLLVGWMGLSAEMMRRIILPRARDRDAPVRLMQEFQRTGDARVFQGQPRLLVPHPDLQAVRGVLLDPRLQERLPPSLQPQRPLGPLSRGVRWLLRRESSPDFSNAGKSGQ